MKESRETFDCSFISGKADTKKQLERGAAKPYQNTYNSCASITIKIKHE